MKNNIVYYNFYLVFNVLKFKSIVIKYCNIRYCLTIVLVYTNINVEILFNYPDDVINHFILTNWFLVKNIHEH